MIKFIKKIMYLNSGNEFEYRCEVIGIINELLIAFCFMVGSIFFFFDKLLTAGIWLFVVGSTQMLVNPIIKITKLIFKKRFK